MRKINCCSCGKKGLRIVCAGKNKLIMTKDNNLQEHFIGFSVCDYCFKNNRLSIKVNII